MESSNLMNWLPELVGSTVLTVIIFLLQRKDTQQERAIQKQDELIKDLYAKHEVDVQRLHDLELRIVSNHYDKAEINGLLIDIKTKLDKIIDKLIGH